jgi:hypothetical protein
MLTVVRAFFPALILLRLGDLKKPAMDKLYFYVRQMKKSMHVCRGLLDELQKQYDSPTERDTTKRMLRFYLGTDDDTSPVSRLRAFFALLYFL